MGLTLLILVTHSGLLLALVTLGGLWLMLVPVALFLLIFNVMKQGRLALPRSVVTLSYRRDKWYLGLRGGARLGPFKLAPATQLGLSWLRLSLVSSGSRLPSIHLLVTPAMVEPDNFRKLQVLLRWQAPKSG